jgi:hypothetical protein
LLVSHGIIPNLITAQGLEDRNMLTSTNRGPEITKNGCIDLVLAGPGN